MYMDRTKLRGPIGKPMWTRRPRGGGYVYLKTPKGWMFEHQYAMTQHIGRDLVPGETVHHINGIKNDNHISNLQLWTQPHPSGIRAIDALNWARRTVELYTPIEAKLK